MDSDKIIIDEKPNLRSKGKRRGIKTGNTVKWNSVDSKYAHNSYSSITIHEKHHNFQLYQQRSTNHNNYRNASDIDAMVPGIEYSLNKKKRWEEMKKLEKELEEEHDASDEEGTTTNQNGKTKGQKVITRTSLEAFRNYPILFDEKVNGNNSEDEESTGNFTKNRKGKHLTRKRVKGKKGVKKSQQRPRRHSFDVIYEKVEQSEKNKYPMYHMEDAGYISPDYMKGISKNHKRKRRRELQSPNTIL